MLNLERRSESGQRLFARKRVFGVTSSFIEFLVKRLNKRLYGQIQQASDFIQRFTLCALTVVQTRKQVNPKCDFLCLWCVCLPSDLCESIAKFFLKKYSPLKGPKSSDPLIHHPSFSLRHLI